MSTTLTLLEQDPSARPGDGGHDTLRLWLQLLTCTNSIERALRRRLRDRFATTLARFDLMAQLDRSSDGMRMGELSEKLMVTGGNVTGLVSQLVNEGKVERTAEPDDRRAYVVRLTAGGRKQFREMAVEHAHWVAELLAAMPAPDRARLFRLLGNLKSSVRGSETSADDPSVANATERDATTIARIPRP